MTENSTESLTALMKPQMNLRLWAALSRNQRTEKSKKKREMKMNKKFEFTGETMVDLFGRTLKRIRALVKIECGIFTVNPGDLGGWLEKEENLSSVGNAWVCDDARVCDDAVVKAPDHVVTVGRIGSRFDTTTFFRNKEGVIKVKCGCFIGSVDAFLAKVEVTHQDNKHAKVYRLAAELAKAQIDTTPFEDELPNKEKKESSLLKKMLNSFYGMHPQLKCNCASIEEAVKEESKLWFD